MAARVAAGGPAMVFGVIHPMGFWKAVKSLVRDGWAPVSAGAYEEEA
jgi:hypothetical protein